MTTSPKEEIESARMEVERWIDLRDKAKIALEREVMALHTGVADDEIQRLHDERLATLEKVLVDCEETLVGMEANYQRLLAAH
jgi:hypothetical protein